MTYAAQQIDNVLDQLIRDIEGSVHAFYRGEIRHATSRVKSDSHRLAARDALRELLGQTPPKSDTAPMAVNASALSPEEVVAITRCITGWLPMGPPAATSPESRCIPAARELLPTWGERERARAALRRAATTDAAGGFSMMQPRPSTETVK
jgi:hypothetical protein